MQPKQQRKIPTTSQIHSFIIYVCSVCVCIMYILFIIINFVCVCRGNLFCHDDDDDDPHCLSIMFSIVFYASLLRLIIVLGSLGLFRFVSFFIHFISYLNMDHMVHFSHFCMFFFFFFFWFQVTTISIHF